MQSLPRTRSGRNRQEMAQCRHSSKTRTHLHSNWGGLLGRHLLCFKSNHFTKHKRVFGIKQRLFPSVCDNLLDDRNPHQVWERSQNPVKARSRIRKALARRELCTKALQLRLQSAGKIFAQRFAIKRQTKSPTLRRANNTVSFMDPIGSASLQNDKHTRLLTLNK